MILLSGDLHANELHELTAINSRNVKLFCEKASISKSDIKYHIILGDTGLLWPGDAGKKNDEFIIDFLDHKSFITLCILGNHDNYDAITKLPKIDIGLGNPVWKVSEKVYFLMRGKVYQIEDKKILALGGGLSIDKDDRIEGVTWWRQEQWSYIEVDALMKSCPSEVDYIVSHTPPLEAKLILKKDWLTDYFDETERINSFIAGATKFKHWFFGHYHQVADNDKFSCLYKNLRIIK